MLVDNSEAYGGGGGGIKTIGWCQGYIAAQGISPLQP